MHDQGQIELAVNGWALGAFIAYLLLISLIGIMTTRFSSSGTSAFFIGNRSMNKFVVALSAVVSGRSAWLLLGFTGMSYKMGAPAIWAAVGYITVEFFLFFFYARRLRRFSESYDCITLPDFYAARFGDKDNKLRALLSIVMILFLVSYVSAQFVGGGKAFASGFGLSQSGGMWLTATIVLVYTLLGGFLAVSLTDMLQALFMIVALLVLPVIAVIDFGGWSAVAEALKGLNPGLLNPTAIAAGAMIGFLGIGLGSPGNPHILVRYMSIKDPSQLKYSAVVGTIWNVLMAGGAFFIGLVGRAYFPEAAMIPGGDTEHLYPALARLHLHPVLFGIVVASIFAAIMSTADSQLLVAASSVVVDIYRRILKRDQDIDERKLVLLSRIAVILLVVIAIGLGIIAKQLVFWLVLFAWAGLGAALGPTSILALYWKRCTRAGVIAGMLAGTVTTIIWYYTPALKSRLYELIPAFAVGLIVTIFVSYLSKPPSDVGNAFKSMDDF